MPTQEMQLFLQLQDLAEADSRLDHYKDLCLYCDLAASALQLNLEPACMGPQRVTSVSQTEIFCPAVSGASMAADLWLMPWKCRDQFRGFAAPGVVCHTACCVECAYSKAGGPTGPTVSACAPREACELPVTVCMLGSGWLLLNLAVTRFSAAAATYRTVQANSDCERPQECINCLTPVDVSTMGLCSMCTTVVLQYICAAQTIVL